MPIYDFICRDCGGKFDKLVSVDWKSAGLTCPECGSAKLEKAVSKVGFSSGGVTVTSGDSTCTSCNNNTCSICN